MCDVIVYVNYYYIDYLVITTSMHGVRRVDLIDSENLIIDYFIVKCLLLFVNCLSPFALQEMWHVIGKNFLNNSTGFWQGQSI